MTNDEHVRFPPRIIALAAYRLLVVAQKHTRAGKRPPLNAYCLEFNRKSPRSDGCSDAGSLDTLGYCAPLDTCLFLLDRYSFYHKRRRFQALFLGHRLPEGKRKKAKGKSRVGRCQPIGEGQGERAAGKESRRVSGSFVASGRADGYTGPIVGDTRSKSAMRTFLNICSTSRGSGLVQIVCVGAGLTHDRLCQITT